MSYNPNLPKGQATMAESAPVVLSSNQASIPVAATLTAETTKVIGTINISAAQAVAIAAGSAVIGHVIVDSGAIVVTNAGTFAVQAATTIADGADVTLGAKADAKSVATDTTAISIMQVLKQISASVQAPPSQAVTGTFWQATQPVSGTVTANLGTLAAPLTIVGAGAAATALRIHLSDESLAALENITVVSSGTVTATLAAETTKVIGTVNISAGQTIAAVTSITNAVTVNSHAVTNAGTFAVQAAATLAAETTKVIGTVNISAAQTIAAVTSITNAVTVNAHAVTNAGTFAVQVDGAALTALQLLDDTVATLGTTTYTEAATKGLIMSAVRRDANTTLVDTTNEVAPLQVNATGELKVAQIQALPAGTNNIGDVDVASIAAGDNNIGNVDVVTMPTVTVNTHAVTVASGGIASGAIASGAVASGALAAGSIASGAAVSGAFADGAIVVLGARADAKSTATDTTAITIMQVLKQISASVQAPPSQAVTNAGTFAVQAASVGTVADDSPTPGIPQMIGGSAVETDGTDPTSVSEEADVAICRTDRNRRLLVNIAHPRMTAATENFATAQTNNPILAAPGASLSLYITDIIVSNGATAGSIRFVEDTAGTPVIKINETYMAINGGAVMHFMTPIRITANKDFGYTSTTVTTHSITVSGYIAP